MLKAETIGGDVMAFQKILESDYNTKGARLLETKPDMDAETLKRKFDEISLDVIIPKHNEMADSLNQILGSATGTQTVITNDDTKLVTGGAVSRYVVQMGGGDMTKAIYDTDDDGVVDDSDKLGGKSASDYQLKSDDTLDTTEKTVVGGINELKAEMDNKSANYNSCTTYSSTATYALGDLAIYDNKLYRCITDITTPEAWSVGKWTQITDSQNGMVYNTSDSHFYGVRGADSVLKKLGSCELSDYSQFTPTSSSPVSITLGYKPTALEISLKHGGGACVYLRKTEDTLFGVYSTYIGYSEEEPVIGALVSILTLTDTGFTYKALDSNWFNIAVSYMAYK